ncbi:hypothetical protein SASPL_152671 [Salvia splendens]|uniref:Disease resistance R13L4/SHOC-2-like LRR domain-containing protein n=1 Tax=Salvia splendens TaxID=180675 RepID=A0A8X8W4C0_SALSN|nr:hypothetical protein SASPL_152671 [Salvia splendens]
MCFLYLGVLRNGESMAAADLYRIWISQGMISEESSDKSPMELAEDHLREKEKYKVQTLEYTGGRFCDFLDDALSSAITRHLVIHFKEELFKSLRNLAFEGFTFIRGKLPKGVTSLVHLRNLRFRKCELDMLQSSIKHLVFLEILDFLSSKNTKIPGVVKEMDRLRQLALPRYDMERIGKYQLKLDEGLNHLEALQGLNSLVHKG